MWRWCLLPAGNLSVLYLGTEPPKQALAFSESRPVDYAAMEQERVALLSKLKAAGGTAGLEAAAAAKAEAKAGSSQAALVLKAKVPSRLDSADSSGIGGGFGAGLGGGVGGQQGQLTVTLLLSNMTTAALLVSKICLKLAKPTCVFVYLVFDRDCSRGVHVSCWRCCYPMRMHVFLGKALVPW